MKAAIVVAAALVAALRPIPAGDPVPVFYEFPTAVVEMGALPPSATVATPTVQQQVMATLVRLGRADDYDCLAYIFAGESSWRPDAIGDSGRSFGLPQRHAPAHGAPPWPWPVDQQTIWAVEYADARYGSPCEAADVWRRRAEARGGAGSW